MPKRTDLKTIMVIGSGPIVIGQACEFDYSGTQACKALRSLGYRVVLLNSNPATIMTDPSVADSTYIEPLTVDAARQVIELGRPAVGVLEVRRHKVVKEVILDRQLVERVLYRTIHRVRV